MAVLLGIALMTFIVVDFAMTSGLGFVSAANQANELRAGFLARSGVSIGLALLAEDARAKLAAGNASAATPCESFNDDGRRRFRRCRSRAAMVSLSIVVEARNCRSDATVNQLL